MVFIRVDIDGMVFMEWSSWDGLHLGVVFVHVDINAAALLGRLDCPKQSRNFQKVDLYQALVRPSV